MKLHQADNKGITSDDRGHVGRGSISEKEYHQLLADWLQPNIFKK